MKIPRVSIRSLMVVILVIAVASVALMRPTRLWAASIFSLTFAAFTVATLGAVFARGASRSKWMGFAIGGWLGLILHFSPMFASLAGNTNTYASGITPLLPTTALLDVVYPWFIKDAYDAIPIPSGFGPPPPPFDPYQPSPLPSAVEPKLIPDDATSPPATPSPVGAPPNLPVPNVMPAVPRSAVGLYWTSVNRSPYIFIPERSNAFLTIGHSLFCLLFAALTSLLSARMHASWSEPLPKPTN